MEDAVLGHQAGPGANSLLFGAAFLVFYPSMPNKCHHFLCRLVYEKV